MQVSIHILSSIDLPANVFFSICKSMEQLRDHFKTWFQKDWGNEVKFSIDMNAIVANRQQMQYLGNEVKGVFIHVLVEDEKLMRKLSTTHVIGAFMAVFPATYEIAAVVRPYKEDLIETLQ